MEYSESCFLEYSGILSAEYSVSIWEYSESYFFEIFGNIKKLALWNVRECSGIFRNLSFRIFGNIICGIFCEYLGIFRILLFGIFANIREYLGTRIFGNIICEYYCETWLLRNTYEYCGILNANAMKTWRLRNIQEYSTLR